MRLELFSEGDTVLLLGEGNFSFAVCLLNHQLPIKITATCFEEDLSFEKQLENVTYLISKEVPVYFNVDATKVHKNPKISSMKFTKIIFNFPHVGGKMKIHLNRQLLMKIFESCSQIISENGKMIVSLCQGQGGTPADKPQRKWNDSWQVTEMAAHGDFVLTAVEKFQRENFTDYTCIGYRSQDVKFHLEGALVHIFQKREPPFVSLDESVAIKRLGLVPLGENCTVSAPIIYSELYINNPLLNLKSPFFFLKSLLIKTITETMPTLQLHVLTNENIPLYLNCESGVSCTVTNINSKFSLRHKASQVIPHILKSLSDSDIKNKITFFPGMYFNPFLSDNFLEDSPVNVSLLILGCDMYTLVFKYLNDLSKICKDESNIIAQKLSASEYSKKPSTEVLCVDKEKKNNISAAVIFPLEYGEENLEAAILNADLLLKYFFNIGNWREAYSKFSEVMYDDYRKPTMIPPKMFPLSYEFDITLRSTKEYAEKRLFEILWLAAGQIIESVKKINCYKSDQGWTSNCFRITYKSLDKPLYRNRVIDIHSKLVGKMLELGLNVVIT